MSVTPGHFTLSPEQRKFREMLKHYPCLQRYWDFDNRECDIEGLKNNLGALSHGEQLMARFLLSVWLGDDETLPFPLVEAARSLDTEDIERIVEWLHAPFFP